MTSYIKNGEDVQDVRDGVLEEVRKSRVVVSDEERIVDLRSGNKTLTLRGSKSLSINELHIYCTNEETFDLRLASLATLNTSQVMSLRFSLEDLENSEIEKKKKQIAERIEELKEEINREYDEKEEEEIDIKVCVEIANEGVFYYRCLERVKEIE